MRVQQSQGDESIKAFYSGSISQIVTKGFEKGSLNIFGFSRLLKFQQSQGDV